MAEIDISYQCRIETAHFYLSDIDHWPTRLNAKCFNWLPRVWFLADPVQLWLCKVNRKLYIGVYVDANGWCVTMWPCGELATCPGCHPAVDPLQLRVAGWTECDFFLPLSKSQRIHNTRSKLSVISWKRNKLYELPQKLDATAGNSPFSHLFTAFNNALLWRPAEPDVWCCRMSGGH